MVFVMKDHEVWDEQASTLRLQDAQHVPADRGLGHLHR
jgi:hypothetical protein